MKYTGTSQNGILFVYQTKGKKLEVGGKPAGRFSKKIFYQTRGEACVEYTVKGNRLFGYKVISNSGLNIPLKKIKK
jgi:hypothetical protein